MKANELQKMRKKGSSKLMTFEIGVLIGVLRIE